MLNRSPDSGGASVRTHSGYERVSFFRRSGRLSVWRVFFFVFYRSKWAKRNRSSRPTDMHICSRGASIYVIIRDEKTIYMER